MTTDLTPARISVHPGNPTPRLNSLKAKLLRFFEDNPDEELDYALIEQKFAVSEVTSRKAITALRNAGLVESVFVIRLKSQRARDGYVIPVFSEVRA